MENENSQILIEILKEASKTKNPKMKNILIKSAVRYAKSGDVSRFDVKNALVFYAGFSQGVDEFLSLY